MRIDAKGASSVLNLGRSLPANSSAKGASFFESLIQATGQGTADASTGIGKNSYTGFFAEIQEKRMEELREKILEEMGLTEEMLDQMDPEARGRVETIIAKEIQKRLTAQSAMEEDQEQQALHKRMLLANVDFLSL